MSATHGLSLASSLRNLGCGGMGGTARQELARYDAARLLTDLLEWARMLAELLDEKVIDEWDYEALLRDVASVQSAIQRVRKLALAEKLERIEGRTPEEAAAFEDAARRLRGA